MSPITAIINQYMDLSPVPAQFSAPMATVAAAAKTAGLELAIATSLPAGLIEPPQISKGANRADLFRFNHLAKTPADIYLDADVSAKSIFVPDKTDKPYFSAHVVNNRIVQADVWAIHANGQAAFFQELWDKAFPAWQKMLRVGRVILFSNYICSVLQHMPAGSFYLIPDGYYTHGNVKSWRK